jgi:hypothetical protein
LRHCRHATARCATARMAEPSPAASGRADYATAFPCSRCTSCALPWGRLRGHIPQRHCRCRRAAVVRGHASADHAGADYGHPVRGRSLCRPTCASLALPPRRPCALWPESSRPGHLLCFWCFEEEGRISRVNRRKVRGLFAKLLTQVNSACVLRVDLCIT